jgi:hypothetical protein
MDDNNLNQRIERIHQSLSLLKNKNLAGLKMEVSTSDNFNYIHVDFNNGKTEAELKNSVFSLIANIALLKDHLKVWCEKNKISFNVENVVDSNKNSVAIVNDLNNIEKHLELNRDTRSGFLPKIINLQQALQTSAGSEAGGYAVFTCDPTTGEMKTETGGGGTVTLVINGNIVNEKGEIVGDLMKICSDAIDVWENEITKLGIILV